MTSWLPTWSRRWLMSGEGTTSLWSPPMSNISMRIPTCSGAPPGRLGWLPMHSFETLVRDGSNACCFGASIGFERELYETFGLPPSYLEACDIMLPFYAHLLKGARFVPRPLLRYRVHAKNSALSLRAERAGGLDRLELVERMLGNHLANAVLMQQEVNRLQVTMPSRYRDLEGRIAPLIATQIAEFAKKLVNARIEINDLRRDTASEIAPKP